METLENLLVIADHLNELHRRDAENIDGKKAHFHQVPTRGGFLRAWPKNIHTT